MPRVFLNNIYTSFQPKSSKCHQQVVVNNVGDRVMFPEKVVISKKKIFTFLAVTATRNQHELMHVAVVQ